MMTKNNRKTKQKTKTEESALVYLLKYSYGPSTTAEKINYAIIIQTMPWRSTSVKQHLCLHAT